MEKLNQWRAFPGNKCRRAAPVIVFKGRYAEDRWLKLVPQRHVILPSANVKFLLLIFAVAVNGTRWVGEIGCIERHTQFTGDVVVERLSYLWVSGENGRIGQLALRLML